MVPEKGVLIRQTWQRAPPRFNPAEHNEESLMRKTILPRLPTRSTLDASIPELFGAMRNGPLKAWLVIADASRALLLTPERGGRRLEIIRELTHPLSRARESELTVDQPGRIRLGAGKSAVSSMGRKIRAKDIEAERFARDIMRQLHQAQDAKAFDVWSVVAPPRFLGLLRHMASRNLRRTLVGSAHKDLTAMAWISLTGHLQQIMKPIARDLAVRTQQ